VRPSPTPPTRPPAAQRLLDRLDRIGEVLRDRGDALALIGLGSVGRDLHRLDEHSDLDFFAVVEDEAKGGYLTRLDWLEAAAPVAFSFANTVDGRKVLFDDGIYAEYAVFTLAELRQAAYPPGRLVWHRADAPAGLELPLRPPPAPERDPAFLVHEAMTNLLVGLHRAARGERLSAQRLIQVSAVDRLLHLLELSSGTARARTCSPPRGASSGSTPAATCRWPSSSRATGRTPGPRRAVLRWLRTHVPEHLDPVLLAAVEDLLQPPPARGPVLA
jgi:hypothetical protein